MTTNSLFRLIAVLLGCSLHIAVSAQTAPQAIHVFVALADNKYQGIVPVATKLGNGDDPEHNLYWGAAYGVKTFLSRSKDWQLLATSIKPRNGVLERCIFKHRTRNVFLIADAYQGKEIKQAIYDFLATAAGDNPEATEVKAGAEKITLNNANTGLVAYVGHEGFMDFQLDKFPEKRDGVRREAVILACISKSYFAAPLKATGAYPLLWTTGLMAPESYTLKVAVDGWIAADVYEHTRQLAAAAYDQYQKCGIKAARRLLVTGW